MHTTLEQLYDIYLEGHTISTDTRQITPGCLFFALKGDTFDGNTYAAEALKKGAAYAVVAALLTLIMVYGGGDMLVRLLANVMIVLMALPFVCEKMVPKFQEKMNPVIIEEVKNFTTWLTKQEKYIGYVGAVISLLLFAVLFR